MFTRPTETLILSSVTFIPVQQAFEMRLGVAGGAVQASRFMNELGPTRPAAIAGNAFYVDPHCGFSRYQRSGFAAVQLSLDGVLDVRSGLRGAVHQAPPSGPYGARNQTAYQGTHE